MFKWALDEALEGWILYDETSDKYPSVPRYYALVWQVSSGKWKARDNFALSDELFITEHATLEDAKASVVLAIRARIQKQLNALQDL